MDEYNFDLLVEYLGLLVEYFSLLVGYNFDLLAEYYGLLVEYFSLSSKYNSDLLAEYLGLLGTSTCWPSTTLACHVLWPAGLVFWPVDRVFSLYIGA